MTRYADLEFDEKDLRKVTDLLEGLDCVEFESLMQEFVDYSISAGLFRRYIMNKNILNKNICQARSQSSAEVE